MADSTGVRFDRPSARRIADVVRAYEREPLEATGRQPRQHPAQPETLWAYLDERSDSDDRAYAWYEVAPSYDQSEWATPPDARASTLTETPAMDYQGNGSQDLTDTVVLLRRTARPEDEGSDPDHFTEWVIVPAGTTPDTFTLNPVDTWLRVTGNTTRQEIHAGDWRGRIFDCIIYYRAGTVAGVNDNTWSSYSAMAGFYPPGADNPASGGLGIMLLTLAACTFTLSIEQTTGKLIATVSGYSTEIQFRIVIPWATTQKDAPDLTV